MKRNFILIACLLNICFIFGCADLLTQNNNDTTSKINSFTINPQAVTSVQPWFYININAIIGYNMYLSIQRVGTFDNNRTRVYEVTKNDFDNQTIAVQYIASSGVANGGGILKTSNMYWKPGIPVESGILYNFYLTVCDFAMVAGTGYCQISDPIQVRFD